jgi:hypothetical protein
MRENYFRHDIFHVFLLLSLTHNRQSDLREVFGDHFLHMMRHNPSSTDRIRRILPHRFHPFSEEAEGAGLGDVRLYWSL